MIESVFKKLSLSRDNAMIPSQFLRFAPDLSSGGHQPSDSHLSTDLISAGEGEGGFSIITIKDFFITNVNVKPSILEIYHSHFSLPYLCLVSAQWKP